MDKNKNASGGKESLSHKVGDKIERMGEKLKHKGAGKLGASVYRAGNKIEHSGEDK
jgi:hypothetical protein